MVSAFRVQFINVLPGAILEISLQNKLICKNYKKFTVYFAKTLSTETAVEAVTTPNQLPQDLPYHRVTNLSPRKLYHVFCDKGRKKIKRKLVYPGKCEKHETEISIKRSCHNL